MIRQAARQSEPEMKSRCSCNYSPLITSRPWTCRALFLSSAISPTTVLSIPFLIETGFAPAVTFKSPSLINSLAKTEAVVVPSPAESLVLLATCKPQENGVIKN